VITIQLNNQNALVSNGGIWLAENDGGAVTLPTGNLDAAEMQVKQEMLQDTADLLARRVDMNSHAYTFPLMHFDQQEVTIKADQSADIQTKNLTGFRAGEVQRILLWLTKDATVGTMSTGGVPSAGYVPGIDDNGYHAWAALSDVTLTYNGEIFFTSSSRSSNIWNLVCDTKEPGVNSVVQDASGNPQSYLYTYVDVPFSQVCVPYDKEMKLVHGKPVLNAVIQLSFKTPTSANDYTLHAMYLYNASLLCSRGSAEYVF
jgi:hypothetical protein